MSRFRWQLGVMVAIASVGLIGMVSSNLSGGVDQGVQELNKQLGQQFHIPYQLTDTNHFLIRAD